MSRPFEHVERPAGFYLLNHSVGIPPASLGAHLADGFVAEWLSDPSTAWPRWEEELAGFHAELARLFNHAPEWFCHQVNVSSGVTKILHTLPLNPQRPVNVASLLLTSTSFTS